MIAVLFLILFLIIVGYICINLLYIRTNDYKNDHLPYRKFNSSISSNLKFVNFGSTYALYAFDGYKDLQLDAFNFSLPSESLEIDRVLLHKYSDKIAHDAVVVFCLAACVSYYRYKFVVDKSNYYGFLGKNEIPCYSFTDYLKYHFPLCGRRIKKVFRIFIDKSKNNSIYSGPYITEEQSQKNMKSVAECWISLFRLKDMKQADKSEDNEENLQYNIEVLHSMFDFCLEKGWHPIVVIPPFSASLNNYFGEDFIEHSMNRLIKGAIGNKDIPVLNYRTSKEFQNQISFFEDGGFKLNKCGSMNFLKILMKELSSHGYILNNSTIGKRI